jgi:hypothetical protein
VLAQSTTKMRARKVKPRDRATPARATGAIICDLRVPAIEENFVRWFVPTSNHTRAGVRRFIVKNLPKDGIGLEGASFVISAEVRRRSGGISRKRLVTWCSGEEIQVALERAASDWAQLPKEEWKGEAVEVELLSLSPPSTPQSSTTRRARCPTYAKSTLDEEQHSRKLANST